MEKMDGCIREKEEYIICENNGKAFSIIQSMYKYTIFFDGALSSLLYVK